MIQGLPEASDLLFELANQLGHKKRLLAGEIVTPQSAGSAPIGFVMLSGVCRVVHPVEDGTQIIKSFLRKGDFGITPYEADTISAETYVDAVTDSEMLVAPWKMIEQRITSSPEIHEAVQKKLAAHTAWKGERWIEDRTMSSTERYLKLQAELHAEFQRIPLHMIASYVGVSPVQLSRLRRKLKGV